MKHIQLHHICKSYLDGNHATRQVLKDFDLELEQGSFTAIMGPSGVGKTTLLNILGTLLVPDSGEYLLGGRRITWDMQELPSIRNREIGFLFQDYRLLPQLSALDNILLPLLAQHDRATDEQLQYAHSLMKQMSVDHTLNQLPATLSGGEQARIALCRALICRPSLLLADEPTGQLDAENARRIMQLLRQVNAELGTTIIMVTHSTELVKDVTTLQLSSVNAKC